MAINPEFYGECCEYDKVYPDGRIIKKGVFADQNGVRVPLLGYFDEERLGDALLEVTDDGVIAHLHFDDSPIGNVVREMSERLLDDIELSIFAINLEQDAIPGDSSSPHARIVKNGEIKCVYFKLKDKKD